GVPVALGRVRARSPTAAATAPPTSPTAGFAVAGRAGARLTGAGVGRRVGGLSGCSGRRATATGALAVAAPLRRGILAARLAVLPVVGPWVASAGGPAGGAGGGA